MDKILNQFNIAREELTGLSDETIALLLVAKKLDVIAGKASVLDGEQMGMLKDKLVDITGAVFGVGQMVEKIGRDECAEIVTNEQVEQ